MHVELPPPSDNQPFLVLTPLYAGQATVPEYMVVSDPEPDKTFVAPALSFLLRHSSSGTNILFDLGIKKDLSDYAPSTQKGIIRILSPCSGDPGLVDSLRDSGTGVSPADVSIIFISHIHW
jgi:hypothetical protein